MADSLRPFTIESGVHFSFFTDLGSFGASSLYFAEACEARISHFERLAAR